jgi:hypothetical protein
VLKRRLILFGIPLLVAGAWLLWHEREQKVRSDTCLAALAERIQAGVDPEALFTEEFERLQTLVEQSLVARAEMLQVRRMLDVDADAPITAAQLVTLKEGTHAYLEVREGLYRIARAYECAGDVDRKTLAEYRVEPDLRLKALMLSLGAALTLYDNYMLGVVLFESETRLRRIINDPDSGFGIIRGELEEMTLAASSIRNRERVRRAIKFFEREKTRLAGMNEDSDYAYLAQLIDTSPSYNYVRKIRLGEIALQKLEAFTRIGGDSVVEIQAGGFDIISGLFGNTVGLYEARKGKLYGDEEVLDKVKATLQPLDILLEKTPFRLSDKLIPGHFGHVALWAGTQQEMIGLDVWSHEAVQPHQGMLAGADGPDSKSGHQVIEALRSGVQLSTLEHFMNVDDLAILRPVFEDDEREALMHESLVLAMRQVGKKYDFNFDVDTTDKIVCSELAYIALPSVTWPTERKLGRYTISPDNVAYMARKNVPLELVLFYRDGELVAPEEQLPLFNELLTE